MKILIDARLYGLEHAGLGRYVMNLVEELKSEKRKVKSQDIQYIILLRKKYFNKLEFPKSWKKVCADFRHYTITEQIELPKIIYRERPDLCHFPHFNVPLFYNGPYLVTLHDMEMHKSTGADTTTRKFYSYKLWRLGYKLIFAAAALRAKKIIVPSHVVREEIQAYYKLPASKFEVIYEGVDNKFSEVVSKSKETKVLNKFKLSGVKYFFYNGNAYPHKNLPMAIEAIKKLSSKIQNQKSKIQFVIASSRSIFTERLKKIIEEKIASECVKQLGFVSDEELVVLHKNSVAFLYPSFMEGFGLQGLEAMASRTVVCASDIPIFKEVYKDNAFYFDSENVNSIVQTMKKVLQLSKSSRESWIKKTHRFVKDYSWSKMGQETLRIYNNLLHE